MRCLTVRQPWASLIISGAKRVENRTWTTNYRGPLAIHAGANRDVTGAVKWLTENELPAPSDPPYGAILGVVNLIDVIRSDDAEGLARHGLTADKFVEGPFCWVLSNPRPLEAPLPYTGQLGLFSLPAEVVLPGDTQRRLL